MLSIEEIKAKKKELETKRSYLYDFCYANIKGSNVKHLAEREIAAFDREIKILEWVINDHNLPF